MSRNVIWDLTANIIGFRIDGKMDEKALVAASLSPYAHIEHKLACLGLTQNNHL